jgi:hypothetical protein
MSSVAMCLPLAMLAHVTNRRAGFIDDGYLPTCAHLQLSIVNSSLHGGSAIDIRAVRRAAFDTNHSLRRLADASAMTALSLRTAML